MFTKSLVAGLCLSAVLVSADDAPGAWMKSTTSPTKITCGDDANTQKTVPVDPLPKGAATLWDQCDDLKDIAHCSAGLIMCEDGKCRKECSGNKGPKTYINAEGKACHGAHTTLSDQIYHCADDTACLRVATIKDAAFDAKLSNCCDDNEAKKCPAGMFLCADKNCHETECTKLATPQEDKNCQSVCAGHCGETEGLKYKSDPGRTGKDKGDKCYCDAKCVENNDCCDPDTDFSYTDLCGCEDKATNCQSGVGLVDDNGGNNRTNGTCYCDEKCEASNDCCQDDFNYNDFCKGGVCVGHCDEEIIVRGNVKCWCDSKCSELGDCCQGFVYSNMC